MFNILHKGLKSCAQGRTNYFDTLWSVAGNYLRCNSISFCYTEYNETNAVWMYK